MSLLFLLARALACSGVSFFPTGYTRDKNWILHIIYNGLCDFGYLYFMLILAIREFNFHNHLYN